MDFVESQKKDLGRLGRSKPNKEDQTRTSLSRKTARAPGIDRPAVHQATGWYASYKAAFELIISAGLLMFAAPLMLAAAVLLKLTSRGPVFYSQTRLGWGGKPYTIFKLRSMRDNCEMHSGVCWSTAGDERVTSIGKLLRRTHIDELPQLWNVLRGDMSLVGPRPERPEFMPVLAGAMPLYPARLHVRPGVTGLAQVQLPPDSDLESVRRKLSYDLYYVRHYSIWLDIRLLLATALHMGGVPYSWLGRFLLLPRGEIIDRWADQLADELNVTGSIEIDSLTNPNFCGEGMRPDLV